MALRAMNADAPSRVHTPLQQSAEEVGARTSELLDERGWCLWECRLLDGDVIVVVDETIARDIPPGYPVYMLSELYQLEKADDSTVRLIHEAKKLGGAVVIRVENPQEDMES